MELHQKPRILIVEDDQQVSRWLTRVLEGVGHEVNAVGSGALAIRDATASRPDLVILDLNLPDTSGLQVCQTLRELYDRSILPVLMFTGMSQPIDQLKGFAHGADAYLTKPCDIHELVGMVGSLLEKTQEGETGSFFPMD